MKAKLIVDGHEFDIEIQDPKLQALIAPPKNTGYERVNNGMYYLENDGMVKANVHRGDEDLYSETAYERANYYSNKTVAANNARADKLMRQLRRFAVEHRKNDIDWKDCSQSKFFIAYECDKLDIDFDATYKMHGVIYFDSQKTVELAIETFHDELMWYFIEYKDSL